ncbi:MAG: DEAD/DEAH box helicase, partial [Chloroflexota bacterium]|nr:DEAD/DEAH box helicase [Chloroflexota bacterium]
TRPDKEHGTGPDVLWISEDGCAVVMEVKTNKRTSSSYKKDDLGQLRDHVQWVVDRYQPTQVAPIFVGHLLAASEQANPSSEMLVIELDQFHSVGKRLVSTIQDVAANAIALQLFEELTDKMTARGLLWPEVYESLEKSLLIELTVP